MEFTLLRTSVDEGSQQRKLRKIKKKIKKMIKSVQLSKCTTINVELQQLAKLMRIPQKEDFRGIFTTLSTGGVYRNESSIVNLDNAEGPGTHWVAYTKRGDHAVYFDSFGNLRPPKELVRYLDITQIEYNCTLYQCYDQSNGE